MTVGLLLLVMAAVAPGQIEIRPTALAHVFDARLRTVTPLFGLPGAAVWGEPLNVPFEPVQMAIRRGRVLALAADRRAMVTATLGAASPVWSELSTAFEADDVAMNAGGARGVVMNRKLGLLQFVKGIDTASPSILAVTVVGDPWSAIAVARDSDCVLIAREYEGVGTAIDRICAVSDPLRLLEPGVVAPAALTWLPGDKQIAIADRATNRLLLVDAAAPGAPADLAVPARDLSGPVVMESLASGAVAIAASPQLDLTLVHASHQPPFALLSLPSMPRSVEVLTSGFLFGAGGEDGLAFLADLQEEQIYVVPAR